MATLTTVQIAAAVEQLGAAEPAWAERYATAARLLINGGWHRRPQFITFPGGIVTQPGACSCQEGTGPIVCIHRVPGGHRADRVHPPGGTGGARPRRRPCLCRLWHGADR